MADSAIPAPSINTYPYNIPYSFQYNVKIDAAPSSDASGEGIFQEVSGLNVTMKPEPFSEGGVNHYIQKFPSKVDYSNLVLKRGLLKGSSLATWINNALFNYQFSPTKITISLLGQGANPGEFNPLVTWQVIGAYPVSAQVSALKATDSSLVFETFELAYSYFQNVPVT